MSLFIHRVFITAFVLIASFAVYGQESEKAQDAKAVSVPKIKIPPEAIKTGLGGEVNVRVNIDENGKVIKIEEVIGPGWVCPSVTRSDVLAIRATTISAVENAVYSPAMRKGRAVKSSIWISFIFPENNELNPWKKQVLEKKQDSEKVSGSAANAPPKVINAGVMNGKARKLPKPNYPPEAMNAGVSGKVEMMVYLLEDGTVFAAEPFSGNSLFYPATRKAACEAKFSETRLFGSPVIVMGVISYVFTR